ncbi:MAG: hypothetical protein GXZ06_11310 [Tissierellia bacterium]|nr:hypothetical protein [Tissierellia bacterium]
MNIQVGVNKNIDKARELIYSYFPEKKVKIEEVDYDSRYFFNITPLKNKSLKDFYNKVSELILDLILNIYTDDIINKQINLNYKKLEKDEKKELSEISKKLLLNKDNFLIEKQYINNQIKNYVLDKTLISIDGFITFRLKDFNLLIDLAVDKGIEEFTARKEYQEFVNILRYFVDIQEPKYRIINLILEDDEYMLLDEKGKKIDMNFFKDIIIEIEKGQISKDDILISSLIVLAPENLIIHLEEIHKTKDVIKIITDVFKDNVYHCLGCERCKGRLALRHHK